MEDGHQPVARFIVRRILGAIPVLFGLSLILFFFLRAAARRPGHRHPGPARDARSSSPRSTSRWASTSRSSSSTSSTWATCCTANFGSSIIDNRSRRGDLRGALPRHGRAHHRRAGLRRRPWHPARPAGRPPPQRTGSTASSRSSRCSGSRSRSSCSATALVYVFSVQLHWLPGVGPHRPAPRRAAPSTHIPIVDAALSRAARRAILDAHRPPHPAGDRAGLDPVRDHHPDHPRLRLDVSNEDYVRTARAKGLTERRVNDRHIMRNAWLPVVTVIGLQVGLLLAGAVITETVFVWNGVGRGSSRRSRTTTTSWCSR